jgi:Zn-finger nucleic acid-binding protein
LDGLLGYLCYKCDSKFIRRDDYNRWSKENYNLIESNDLSDKKRIDFLNSKDIDWEKAKKCPECNTIFIKYKIDNNVNFKIEHCNCCGGIWFDSNKWEILKENGAHYNLNNIFTDYWQNKLRETDKKEYFNNLYIKRFGKDDYKILTDFKNWIDSKENKRDIINFLIKK